MSTSTATRPTYVPDEGSVPPPARHLAVRALGAALALGVAYLHVKDQGGFPGDKAPTYVGYGYYALELAGVGAALGLFFSGARHATKAWLLTLGVALGPIAGFVLSRGPGLPDYTDDKGNWTEPLGLASLAVEAALVLLTASVLAPRPSPVA